MESLFRELAGYAALGLEALSVVVIVIGGVETVWRCFAPALLQDSGQGIRRAAWQNFARWLILGLEFTMAADIVRSAIAPSWDDIGRLAAIAAIRTFLNFFLEHDMRAAGAERTSHGQKR